MDFLQSQARQHRNWRNHRPVPFRRRAERFAARNLLGQKAWRAHREQTMNLLQAFLRLAHDGANSRVEPVPPSDFADSPAPNRRPFAYPFSCDRHGRTNELSRAIDLQRALCAVDLDAEQLRSGGKIIRNRKIERRGSSGTRHRTRWNGNRAAADEQCRALSAATGGSMVSVSVVLRAAAIGAGVVISGERTNAATLDSMPR